MAARTFSAALSARLDRAPGQPLVTFYDDATGERVELSVATYANWVAKTANLLQDDLDVTTGDLVLVDLPPHWLGTVWLGAAWSVGAAVTAVPGDRPAAVVCGPGGWEGRAPGVPVVALSLRPFAARFDTAVPDGVVDYGAVVWGQPDDFWPAEPVQPEATAWVDASSERTQGMLLDHAASGAFAASGTRLLTDADPVSERGAEALLGPLLSGGGTVWVRNPRPDAWDRHAADERADQTLRVS